MVYSQARICPKEWEARYIRTYHHHHHHVVLVARISLTLSRHFSLSFIASGRSSGLHTVSSHSCWMYVRAGRPAFDRPCVGVYKSTSLMSSSLLLQQCLACLVRLTWIVFVIGGRWPVCVCIYLYPSVSSHVCQFISISLYLTMYDMYIYQPLIVCDTRSIFRQSSTGLNSEFFYF